MAFSEIAKYYYLQQKLDQYFNYKEKAFYFNYKPREQIKMCFEYIEEIKDKKKLIEVGKFLDK